MPAPTQATRRTIASALRWARAHHLTNQYLALGTLLVFSGALRFIALGSFPANLMADEADNLAFVFQVAYGNGPGLFGVDWKPSPAFSLYITQPFVNLWGNSIFGLRFLPALTSVLALLPLYTLYRRYMAPAAAILSLALLSTTVWYLNFSRSGWENVYVVLETALAFWLLTLALERVQWRYWVLAGVVAASGLYSYFAGRAIIVSLAAYAPFALWQYRNRLRIVLMGYVLLGVVGLALFVPQLPAIKQNPEKFNIRARRVSALQAAQNPGGYFGHYGTRDILIYQIERNARFFFDGSVLGGPSYSPPEQLLQDTRPRYSPFGRPLLDRLSAVLFAAGMLISLRRFVRYSMWWAMLLVPWVITQVLSINTPDAARGIGMLPAIFFFVGLMLHYVWELASSWRPLKPLIVTIVLMVALLSVREYFVWASSPSFLAARQPAVSLSEYRNWRAYQVALAKAHYPPVPVTVWEQIRESR